MELNGKFVLVYAAAVFLYSFVAVAGVGCCWEIISYISEIIFLRKLWFLFSARYSKFSLQKVMFLAIALLLCFLPPVIGTKGGEIGWAQQSSFVDITNLGTDMALDYLTQKRKVMEQVSILTVHYQPVVNYRQAPCPPLPPPFFFFVNVKCAPSGMNPFGVTSTHLLKPKKPRRNYSHAIWQKRLYTGVQLMQQIQVDM